MALSFSKMMGATWRDAVSPATTQMPIEKEGRERSRTETVCGIQSMETADVGRGSGKMLLAALHKRIIHRFGLSLSLKW
jgi:hypothetical protein